LNKLPNATTRFPHPFLSPFFSINSSFSTHLQGIPEDYPIKYTSEIQQRRLDKLDQLRRRGKGPPKKGAGKRAQKK
jgi:small subunit ribosomal protein S33